MKTVKETKVCSKCGVEKNTVKFYLDKKSSDGLESACAECRKKEMVKYYRENKLARYKNKASAIKSIMKKHNAAQAFYDDVASDPEIRELMIILGK